MCTVMHLDVVTVESIIAATAMQFRDEYMLQVVYFWATGKRLMKLSGDAAEAELQLHSAPSMNDKPLLLAAAKLVDDDTIEQLDATKNEQIRAPASSRWLEAKNLAARFDLMSMDPAFLHDYVEHSGILEKDCLYSAYRFHALSGRRRFVKLRSKVKGGFVMRMQSVRLSKDSASNPAVN